MLFNYNKFLQKLKSNENEDKKKIFEKYSTHFPTYIDLPLEEQVWYKDYCNLFSAKEDNVLNLPEDLNNDFDWNLLQKLVGSSFSSNAKYIKIDGGKWELEINVQSNDQFITKKLSELWVFQILRLFEIYVEEQIYLQILTIEEENEKGAIEKQRKSKLLKWHRMINRNIIFDAIGIEE